MTAVPSTQFNPFGDHEKDVKDVRKELEGLVDVFRTEIRQFSGKPITLSAETRQLSATLAKLVNVVNGIEETAVQSLLSELAEPLSQFLQALCHNSEKLKNADCVLLSRPLAKFLQLIADRVTEPFNSDVLEVWAPIFEAVITGKVILLKDVGVVLWKATFAKVSGSLRYPRQLRQALEKLPKRNGLILPPEEKTLSRISSFEDQEEAMDGMGSSQNTFELSQQPVVNEIAEKLLKEQQQKPKTELTPVRRRQSKIPSLLDEDSCDFVAIAATPPSSRKNRLTDRQKEKLAEASAPSTTINYVNEESQSGFQKTEQLKAALSAMNYDVGEDSVSVCAPSAVQPASKAPEVKEEVVVKEETTPEKTAEEPEPVRRATTRSRKSLFENKDDESVESKTGEKMETDKTEKSAKKAGRPKKTPKQCLPEKTPPTKKRLRSALIKTEEEEASEDVSLMPPDAKKVASEDEVKSDEKEAPEDPQMPQKTLEPEEDVEMKEADLSPPKTPSILRVGKTATTPSILKRNDSPMTERKKNRVHFGEESLPQDPPTTPRRNAQIVLAVDVKSPQKTPKTQNPAASTTAESSKPIETTTAPVGLLEIQDAASSTSPFFRSLVGCNDPIERVVRNLAPMCLKTAVDAVKRSLSQAGIKTIGEFAALSKKQLNELAGLKNPKEKCARSVLAEYEAKKRAETRASEERILADSTTIDKISEVEKIFEKARREAEQEVPPLKPLPMIMDVVKTVVPEDVEKPTETPEDSASESPASTIPSVERAQAGENGKLPKEEVRKNLAPIFDKSRTIKMEIKSPKKGKQLVEESEILKDARLLHRICRNLSRAHTLNHLSAEKWTLQLDTINKAAIMFKNVVQERGISIGEWDDVDLENDEEEEEILAPEDEVKRLRLIYRRFARHHALADVRDADWKAVMETVNEGAVILRSIVAARALSF